jgi:hypothetical protein
MTELAWHLMFRTDDDRVIAPSRAKRRLLARTVYKIVEPYGLLSFGAADNHLHLVVCCTREEAGRLAQGLAVALRVVLDIAVPFFPVRFKAIKTQKHLETAFHYALSQRNRHGVHSDPFLDSCSLHELLGARVLPTDCRQRVREMLPRVTRNQLLHHLGPVPLEPCTDLIEPVDAAAGAVGLGSLELQPRLTVAPRAALVQLIGRQLTSDQVAELLGRSPSFVRRMRSHPVAPEVALALRLQLAVRRWLLQRHPQLLSRDPHLLPERNISPALQVQVPGRIVYLD